MIAAERHQLLLKALQSREFLSSDEICRVADVSIATARRDCAELVASGLVERHRGGIGRLRRDGLAMAPFAVREMRQAAEKSAIAAAAAARLGAGDAVFVDGGTSTLHLAMHLGAAPVRVITNSLRLAAAISGGTYANPIEVLVTGGYLLARGGMLIGPQARSGVEAYRARWAFLSAGGVGPEGVFNTDELVQDVERSMIAGAERVAVLADHTKIGARALCRVCDLARIHLLITDRHSASAAVVQRIRDSGVEVVEAEVDVAAAR